MLIGHSQGACKAKDKTLVFLVSVQKIDTGSLYIVMIKVILTFKWKN